MSARSSRRPAAPERTDIGVAPTVIRAIEAAAAAAFPEECCGILLGDGQLVVAALAAANVAPDRMARFEIDPQALVDAHRAARAGGAPVAGYYHSHPRGPAAPSATDRAEAAGDGAIWAIAGPSGVAFWRDDEHGFTPLSYKLAER